MMAPRQAGRARRLLWFPTLKWSWWNIPVYDSFSSADAATNLSSARLSWMYSFTHNCLRPRGFFFIYTKKTSRHVHRCAVATSSCDPQFGFHRFYISSSLRQLLRETSVMNVNEDVSGCISLPCIRLPVCPPACPSVAYSYVCDHDLVCVESLLCLKTNQE